MRNVVDLIDIKDKDKSLVRLVLLGVEMSEQSDDKPISHHDYTWAGIYAELSERYEATDPLQAAPYMAVRLLVMRHGFDGVMAALRERGTAWTATMARHEMALRQEFIARIIADYPPHEPKDIEEAAEEMARDLAAIESEAGQKRLMSFLARLEKRERMFALRHAKVGALTN